jgi:hypothetical protein
VILALTIYLAAAPLARACPFCSAVQQTLTEEISGADAVVIGKLTSAPAAAAAAQGATTKFEIAKVLKGGKLLEGVRTIEVLYFGDQDPGTEFLIIGTDPKQLAWGTPTALSPRAVKYVSQLVKLPESGPERLMFFQNYFEDADPLLAGDSYDEFAKAPYADISKLKDRLDHDKLLGWIKTTETSTSRRRLYLTLLGICGQPSDVPELEAMIRTDDRTMRTALDALIACYLNLRGPDGLPLVEDLFLKNAKAEYTDTYATIMALRFHGQETKVIPRDRLVAAMRLMLDRPQLADLVIPDLARWEDWSVMDRLVDLFKQATDESIWVRVPVINYLRACPLPEAKEKIDELAKIDPDAVRRASNFFPLGGAKPPPGAQRPKEDSAQRPKDGAQQPNDAAEPKENAKPAKADSSNASPDNANALAAADAPADEGAAAADQAPPAADAETPQEKEELTTDNADVAKVPPRPDDASEIAPPDAEPQEQSIGRGVVLSIALGVGIGLFVVMAVILRSGSPRV